VSSVVTVTVSEKPEVLPSTGESNPEVTTVSDRKETTTRARWTALGTLATVTVAWGSLTRTIRSEKEAQWRAERKQAYTTFFALARAAKAATEQPTTSGDSNSGDTNREKRLEALREAHATVVLVGETNALFGTAQELHQTCKDMIDRVLKGKDVSGSGLLERYRKAGEKFFESARKELRLPSYRP
jgi:YD repeat-containing protein